MANWKNTLPSPTLNLSNVYTQISLTDLNRQSTPWEDSGKYVKKYEVVETSEDLLALSCAWYRVRVDHRNGTGQYVPITTLIQKELFSIVTDSDREQARLVRDFYSKKIMMLKLLGRPLTPFKEDLNTFIHDTSGKVSEKMLPLAYRLPEFYEYDVNFEEMKHGLEKKFQTKPKGATKLTSLNTFNVGKRNLKKTEYWMKDENNNAYVIHIPHTNELKHIWDSIFHGSESLTIDGRMEFRIKDDLEYMELSKWKMI